MTFMTASSLQPPHSMTVNVRVGGSAPSALRAGLDALIAAGVSGPVEHFCPLVKLKLGITSSKKRWDSFTAIVSPDCTRVETTEDMFQSKIRGNKV